MGKMEKNWKENYAAKVTKIPKTKRRKYGMKQNTSPKPKEVDVAMATVGVLLRLPHPCWNSLLPSFTQYDEIRKSKHESNNKLAKIGGTV